MATVGEFTVDGTIELLVAGVFVGGVGAVVYLVSEPWLRWMRWAAGGAFGLLLITTGGRLALDPENRDFLLVTNQPLAVGLFGSLFLIFGVLMPIGVSALERRLPAPDGPRPLMAAVPYLALASAGVIFVPFTVLFLFGEDFAPASVFVLIMGIATAAAWFAHCRAHEDQPFARAMRGVGYVSLAGAFVAGALQLADDLADIL